jgi:hypothetical protein
LESTTTPILWHPVLFRLIFLCPSTASSSAPPRKITTHPNAEDERRGAPSQAAIKYHFFRTRGEKPSFRPLIRTASSRPPSVSSAVKPRSPYPAPYPTLAPPSSLIRRTPSHPCLHPSCISFGRSIPRLWHRSFTKLDSHEWACLQPSCTKKRFHMLLPRMSLHLTIGHNDHNRRYPTLSPHVNQIQI